MGTNPRVNTTDGFDPSWECFVDKISIGTFGFPHVGTPENQATLCGDMYYLSDGPHEFTVKVTQRTADGQNFWFDYILYTPSADVSVEEALIRVENVDPAISYSPGWRPLVDLANSTSSSNANISFDFVGTLFAILSSDDFGLLTFEWQAKVSVGTVSFRRTFPRIQHRLRTPLTAVI